MWKFGWFSCSNPFSPTPALTWLMRHDVRFVMSQGDTPYMYYPSQPLTYAGVDITPISKTDTYVEIAKHHQAQRSEPGTWAPFIAWAKANNRPFYYMPDDHEWGGDNWDHTITQANDPGLNIGCVNQTEVNYHWNQGMLAARQYMTDNPVNGDVASVTGDIPAQALVGDTPSASNYPTNYFRVGYDLDGNVTNTNPYIEFFVIDTISYRHPVSAVDNSSKTMLGASQKAWLKSKLVASEATFKPILTNKKLYQNTGSDNTDTWGKYTTERDEILAHFDSNGVTGSPWLAGDRHVPCVMEAAKSAGAAADVLCVCACPVGVPNNADGPSMTLSAYHTWLSKQPSIGLGHNVFGLGIVDDGRLTLQIRSAATNGVMWEGYMVPSSNIVYKPKTRVS